METIEYSYVIKLVTSAPYCGSGDLLPPTVELITAIESNRVETTEDSVEASDEHEVRYDDQRVFVSSVVDVQGPPPNADALSAACVAHASILAEEIGSEDEDGLALDLQTSLRRKLARFNNKIVFEVICVGSEIVHVGVVPGFGADNCWWLRGPVLIGKNTRLCRFDSEYPVKFRDGPFHEVAEALGLSPSGLYVHCAWASAQFERDGLAA